MQERLTCLGWVFVLVHINFSKRAPWAVQVPPTVLDGFTSTAPQRVGVQQAVARSHAGAPVPCPPYLPSPLNDFVATQNTFRYSFQPAILLTSRHVHRRQLQVKARLTVLTSSPSIHSNRITRENHPQNVEQPRLWRGAAGRGEGGACLLLRHRKEVCRLIHTLSAASRTGHAQIQ